MITKAFSECCHRCGGPWKGSCLGDCATAHERLTEQQKSAVRRALTPPSYSVGLPTFPSRRIDESDAEFRARLKAFCGE